MHFALPRLSPSCICRVKFGLLGSNDEPELRIFRLVFLQEQPESIRLARKRNCRSIWTILASYIRKRNSLTTLTSCIELPKMLAGS